MQCPLQVEFRSFVKSRKNVICAYAFDIEPSADPAGQQTAPRAKRLKPGIPLPGGWAPREA
jgi:hypothetical protein